MKNQELMLALFVVLGVVLVTGLVVVPTMEVDAKRQKGWLWICETDTDGKERCGWLKQP